MLSRDEVIYAYRYLLGRDPESEDVIATAMALPDWTALREGVMQSEEYHLHVGYQRFPARWVLAEVMEGRRQMWLDLSDRYVSLACLLGDYEPLESAFVREHLKPGHVFVDVGANVGWYTLLASTVLRPQDQIIAFEPRADTSAWLARTLQVNGLATQVTLHACALGAKRGRMFINHSEGTDNPGGSFMTARPAGGDQVSESVKLETLDSFALPKLDFLKLDVEGAEPQVLDGAVATLKRCRPVILSELHRYQLKAVSGVSPREYLARLKDLGYRTTCLGPVHVGEEIEDFPAGWDGEVVNLGLIPQA